MANIPLSIATQTDLYNVRVVVRASLDVPIHDGVVTNDFRIKQALPTLTYLTEHGARVILLTHVGRDPENSTKPVYEALRKHTAVTYAPDVIGTSVEAAISDLKPGTILLLENLRRHPEEEANDESFGAALAAFGDVYVNDAFAVSHRAHASIVGIPRHIQGYAGITFMEELENLSRALTPVAPSLFILGGAKYETKAPLIENYVETYTNTFIGGALANDFLKGKGYEVGTSLVSPTDLSGNALLDQKNLLLPTDVVVASAQGERTCPVTEVQGTEKILDVGPESIEILTPYIQEAKTVLWNGPLGNYEAGYDKATKACAERIAASGAFSIVGGGDTVAAMESLGLKDSFGFISTAGGAMLEFLEKKTLPGIEALSE